MGGYLQAEGMSLEGNGVAPEAKQRQVFPPSVVSRSMDFPAIAILTLEFMSTARIVRPSFVSVDIIA